MRLICLLTIFIFIIGCNRSGHLETHRWERIDTVVDSLTLTLEKAFLGTPEHDSITILLNQLYSLSAKSKYKPEIQTQLRARYHYWKAKLAARENRLVEAHVNVDKAFSLTDSAGYPYLLWKLKYEHEKIRQDIQAADSYTLLKAYDYFKKVGDSPMEASVLVMMGNLFNGTHDPEMALGYLSKADSVFGMLDFKEYRLKNRLNMASALSYLGRKDSALSILHNIEKDTVARKDFYFYNTVLRNIYSDSRDVAYLREAYNHLSQRDGQRDLKIFYCALLGKEYLHIPAKRDSALFLIDYAIENIDSLDSYNFKAGVAWAASEKYRIAQQFEPAYYWYRYNVALMDSVEAQYRAGRAASAHYFHDLNRVREEKQHERTWFIILLSLAIIGGIIGIFTVLVMLMRKKQKYRLSLKEQHIRYVNSELERERSNRHLMAVSLAKEESERIMDNVKGKVDDLVREGKIDRNQISDIRSELRNYVFQQSDWETFERAFRSANPEFVPNLYNRCKTLSPMQVKLASLTLLGMTIKQIASYLNIKEDSVMQARWRLRNKLSLKPEESIESFLHDLNRSHQP